MAITFTNLGASANPDINSSTDASSYANSSWTPPSSGLIIVFVFGARAGGPDTPTISGNSLTWTQIGSTVTFGSTRGLTLFAANASGSSTGATTVDFGGNTQTHCAASFFLAEGVDLSGGVAAAFVQSPGASGSGTTGTVNLSAAGHADNRPISGWAHVANEASTPRTDWDEMDDLAGTAPVRNLETQSRDDAFETTATATWAGNVAWGGIAAELKAAASGITMDAAQGSYVLTGQAAGLTVQRLLVAAQGSYTLTGQAAALLQGYLLTAAQGSYVLTGQDAELTYTPSGAYSIAAETGTYTLTGQSAGLLAQRLLAANQGAYVLSGQAAQTLVGRLLDAQQGAYVLSGQDAAFLRSRLLLAQTGTYELDGIAATLIWSGSEVPVTPDVRVFVVPTEERLYLVVLDERIYEA